MEKTKDIHQTLVFQTTPETLYDILLDPKRLSEASGNAAVDIERKVGGTFRIEDFWDGIILDLVPGKRIVEALRWSNEELGRWPQGHFSIASYDLSPTEEGTRLIFDHIGVPQSEYEHITTGWNMFHWEPIKKKLAKK